MKILTVIGTRPQIIKYAAVSKAIRAHFDEVLVDTGQHYDQRMAGGFYAEFGIPRPDYDLGATQGRVVPQMAAIMTALDEIVERDRPERLVCFGDTNSTLAAALVAVKHGIAIAHVEAGERNFTASGARVHPATIPEETNRVMTDHVSSLLLCVSERAVASLREERVAGTVVRTGDIMYDLHQASRARAGDDRDAPRRLGVEPGGYYFCTFHRAVNTDARERLAAIVEAVLAADAPVLLPLHPRTRKMLLAFGLYDALAASPRVVLCEPVGYADSIALNAHARAVITDSGGVVREAFFNGVMSVFVDDTTEWIDIVDAGWSTFAGADRDRILDGLGRTPPPARPPLFGSGDAVQRTVDALVQWSS